MFICKNTIEYANIHLNKYIAKAVKRQIIYSKYIQKNMKKKEYQSSVPLKTPMLTERHIEIKIEWAQTHMNDNWDQVIFTEETAFDLFQNKVRKWYKNDKRSVRRLLKSRQKVIT